jgi:hypothetical protein
MVKNSPKSARDKTAVAEERKTSNALDWFYENFCEECDDHKKCKPESSREHACLLANIFFELRSAPRLVVEA